MRLFFLTMSLMMTFHNFGQICNSSIFSTASKIYEPYKMDSMDCEYFVKFANDQISKDSIYIPDCNYINGYLLGKALKDSLKVTEKIYNKRYATRFSNTSEAILTKEFGFIDTYSIGDITPEGKVCFDIVMYCYIQNKRGLNFIDSIRQVSDSLFKINKGYKEIKFKSTLQLDTFIKHHFLQLDSIRLNPKLVLAINFEVTKKGRVKNPKYFKTYYDGEMQINFEKLETGKLKKETEKIFKKMKWVPAYLRGIPINDRKFLIINLEWN